MDSRRVNKDDSSFLYDQLLLGRQDRWLPPASSRVRHRTIQDILAIVPFEDNSHLGSNFGDLLDGRKEAECF